VVARARFNCSGRNCGRPSELRSGQLPEDSMKGILLWLIGIPIPIIILLYLLF
jgi:hypothetical protein